MKQLIEEQKKLPKLICDLVWSVTDGGTKIKESQLLSYQDEPVREYEDILNWHKQSLKQFIDELIAREEGRLSKQKRDNGHDCYDHNCEYCENAIKDNVIEETIAHLKKLKEELN